MYWIWCMDLQISMSHMLTGLETKRLFFFTIPNHFSSTNILMFKKTHTITSTINSRQDIWMILLHISRKIKCLDNKLISPLAIPIELQIPIQILHICFYLHLQEIWNLTKNFNSKVIALKTLKWKWIKFKTIKHKLLLKHLNQEVFCAQISSSLQILKFTMLKTFSPKVLIK